MLATTCPSRETLFRYSVGRLSEEQSEELADHLGSCPDCQATILTLTDADDTLIHRLRMPPGSESYLAEPQLQAAVAEAIALPDPGAIGQEPSGLEDRPAAMPSMLGEYRVLEELGRGGMGRVYKALHTKLDRVVAVKILSRGRGADPQTLSRFAREMRAVGQLAHPNVVQAYDAREIDGLPVLIMEFVEGLDLAEIVRRKGPLPVAEACELVRRTALGLQCAHEHGLVHRDIKPSNIMLTAPIARSGRGAGGEGASLPSPSGRGAGGEGGVAEVKLLDLGLARFYAEGVGGVSPESAGEEMTGTGQAMGTADYMAPEQASDSRTVDIRADIYSLGCTLYKLLSGRAPFSGRQYASALEKMNAHVHQPVPPIRDFAPEVPEELAAILDRMLAKDPGDRFATPAEVAAALEPFCKDANLVGLMVRAMVIEECPLSQPTFGRGAERVPDSSSLPRRAILRRILIGLGFLGAIVAAFAMGIVITIKRDGKETAVDVPEGSTARIAPNGQVEVALRGTTKSAEADNLPAAQPQIKIFTTVNGDAQELSDMLKTLFSGQAAGSETSPVPLRFGVDARTNQVIVSGTMADLNVVEAILTKLDDSEVRHRLARPAPGSGGRLRGVASAGNSLPATPPEVPVVRPIVRQVTHYVDFTGHLEAAQTAEVRARVTGSLAKVVFKPGTMVKQGDLLFEIDPAPFQAEVDKREADVRLAELKVRQSTAELKDAKAAPPPIRRPMEAEQAEAEAALKATKEGVKVARLNLASTRITAPIGGRIGRPLVPVGSLVTDTKALAAIDSVDPMCVAFDVPERTVLELRRNPPHLQEGPALPVLVALSDEKGFPHKSKVESAETRLDPKTGAARWRALLPNPDGLLMPGMSVRVRVVTSDPYKALLVPETAVFPDPANGFHFAVFIVSDQNLVQSREIKAGQRDDDSIVVEKALTADDWVIENADLGQGRWKVGMTIKPLKPPAAPPSFSNGKPSAAAELKVYGGKTFDQWREIARTELDDDLRVKAFAALGAFARNGKSDEAAAAIIEALKVNQSSVALIAAYGTLRMAGPQGEAAIKSGIRDKDPGHRRAAIEVLGVRGGRGGGGGGGGGGGDPEDRRAAIEALEGGLGKNTYAVPALIEALDDPDPGIRSNAGRVLAHIAIATEYEFKEGKLVRVRPEGEIGATTKVVVPALSKLLKDADPSVRARAANSLEVMGTLAKAAIPDLIVFVEAAFSKVKVAPRGSRELSDSGEELMFGIQALGSMGPAASAAVPLLTAIQQATTNFPVASDVSAKYALEKIRGEPKPEIKPDGVHPGVAKPGENPPPKTKAGRGSAGK